MAAAPCGELDRDLVRLNDTLSAVSFPHISALSNPNTIPTSGYAALRRAIGGKSVKSSVKANLCVPIVADFLEGSISGCYVADLRVFGGVEWV